MRWALEEAPVELRDEIANAAKARIAQFEVEAQGVRFVAARDVAQPLLMALFERDARERKAVTGR